MYCSNCGSANKKEAVFCEECGKSLKLKKNVLKERGLYDKSYC